MKTLLVVLLVLSACTVIDIAPIVPDIALRPVVDGMFAEMAVNGTYRSGSVGILNYSWTDQGFPAPISDARPAMGGTRGSRRIRDFGGVIGADGRDAVNGKMRGWYARIGHEVPAWNGFTVEMTSNLLYGATGGWREIPNLPVNYDKPPVFTVIDWCVRTPGFSQTIVACVPWFTAVSLGMVECVHYYPPETIGGLPTNPLHGVRFDPGECAQLRVVPSYHWIAIEGLTTWPLEDDLGGSGVTSVVLVERNRELFESEWATGTVE